ncbi:MAG TPA: LptF/LptG family permease, partial [Caulobacteraceae bacterium]|nr:LptF/LptG family permease [Caulobacteraceae bacterium]
MAPRPSDAGAAAPAASPVQGRSSRARRRRRRLPTLRATLVDRYLLRQVGGPFAAYLGVALLAMMLERTLELVADMAAGGVRIGFLPQLLIQLAPYYLGLALPAALRAALLLAIARLDDGGELEVILASGYSLPRMLAPLVALGLAAGLLSLAVVGVLEPYGRYGFRTAMYAARNAGWSPQLSGGGFQVIRRDVIVTADDAAGARLDRVFIRKALPGGGETVITAARGDLGLAPGARAVTLDLSHGQIFDSRPASGRREPLAARFETLRLTEPLPVRPPIRPRGKDAKELTLPELAGELARPDPHFDRHKVGAEFWYGLARSASLPLLPLFALPLGMAPKRGGRALGMALAGALMLAFHHAIHLAQDVSRRGDADPALAIGAVFATFTALALWPLMTSSRIVGPRRRPLAEALDRFGEGLKDRLVRAIAPLRGGVRGRRSLGSYVAGTVAGWTFATLVAVVALLQMVDLFERSDDILARGLGLAGIARYMLLRAPAVTQQAIGFAALAGAALAFLRLSRSSEVVAMRATGVSLYQVLRMALPVALVLAASQALLADQLAPRAQVALDRWWTATDPARAAGPPLWFRLGDDVVRVGQASPGGARL